MRNGDEKRGGKKSGSSHTEQRGSNDSLTHLWAADQPVQCNTIMCSNGNELKALKKITRQSRCGCGTHVSICIIWVVYELIVWVIMSTRFLQQAADLNMSSLILPPCSGEEMKRSCESTPVQPPNTNAHDCLILRQMQTNLTVIHWSVRPCLAWLLFCAEKSGWDPA